LFGKTKKVIDLFFRLLQRLTIDSLHPGHSISNRRFGESLTISQLFNHAGFFEFSFEFFKTITNFFFIR